MSQVDHQELLERAAADRLTPEEQRQFAELLNSNEAFLQAWQEEKLLRKALAGLKDVPLSSNFTSQVLVELDRQERAERQRPASFFRIPGWAKGLSGLAAACVALMLGVTSYQRHQRTEMAQSLATISDVTTVLATGEEDVDQAAAILTDFDAISRLSSVPAEPELDVELLLALQR